MEWSEEWEYGGGLLIFQLVLWCGIGEWFFVSRSVAVRADAAISSAVSLSSV